MTIWIEINSVYKEESKKGQLNNQSILENIKKPEIIQRIIWSPPLVPKRPSPVSTFGVVNERIMRGQCNHSPSQISLCLWTYPSSSSWQDTSNLTCVESDSNCHFSGQESATIPEMLLKFSELLHHMDGARQGDLIGRDFYAKMDFLNWQGLSRCTYHAYRIRKAF